MAHFYYAQEWVKREALSNAEREARCRKIAKILGRAHNTIDDAMKLPDSSLANDLISGWWEGTSEYAEAAGGWVDLLYIRREFDKALESLTALQAGAVRAADAAHKGRGRPLGKSVLPPDYIYSLAAVYRRHTGSKPGAGDGPFARFLLAFLSAIGHRHNLTDCSVIEAIKDVRTHSLQNPTSLPSPFDN